ncbi:MAG: sigma-70 family RNA polymerase sigma factor [Archangiaceae bacterium]|nr:sigma-70 family RNA polymerase sigma factor [Archangiaceae bacterium]
MDARFARGGRDAFVEAYAAHAREVRHWVRRFFSSAFEQEEAVQEVWLTAHRMQSLYDPAKGPLKPWLRALSANRCRELLRAASRRPPVGVPLDDVSDALWLDAPGPDDAVHSAALRVEVARFAAGLPPDEARVLQLCFVEQRSHAEVAKELGIDERRSKYLKQKVLLAASRDERLRALLSESRS